MASYFMCLLHSGTLERAFMSKWSMINLSYSHCSNETLNIFKLFRTFMDALSISRYYSEPDMVGIQ